MNVVKGWQRGNRMAGRIKRMICSVSFGYEDWLLLCFLFGVCAGTAAALFFGEISLQGAVLGLGKGEEGRFLERFFALLQFRLSQAGLGWLTGLTVCSSGLFGILTMYLGMSLGASLSLLTMQKGLLSLVYFCSLLLPQGLFYGFVWYILAGWAAPGGKKLHLAGALSLMGIIAAGVYLEIFFTRILQYVA